MSTNNRFAAACLITLMCALSACGGGDGASSSTNPTVEGGGGGFGPSTAAAPPASSGLGTWQVTYKGANIRLEIPANASDPKLSKFEDYRKLAGAPKVTYITADVDNINGADGINMYEVIVTTDQGKQIQVMSVSDTLTGWEKAFDYHTNSGVHNHNIGVHLADSASQVFLQPGAKGTFVLATRQPITSAGHVYVFPAGAFDQVEAHQAAG